MKLSTEYLKKNVFVQFKQQWMVPGAPVIDRAWDEEDMPAPELQVVGDDGMPIRRDHPKAKPAMMPFMSGTVVGIDDDLIEIEYDSGAGGRVRAAFSGDVVFSVSIVMAVGQLPAPASDGAEPSRIVAP